MNHRAYLATAGIVTLLACSPAREHQKSDQLVASGAPVILISVDTLRSDHLPAYGYRGVVTPAIDALRADSTLFERAYSPCPMTLPSHLSLLTGLLPTQHGVRNNIGYSFPRGRFPTLATVFRQHGYRTGAAVSSYVLRSDTGIDDGFDFYDDSIPIATAGASSEHQRSGAETLKTADRWLTANAGHPLFFFFHIYEPHAPYAPPQPYRDRYANPYDGEIATADAIVGQFLERLKALGIYDHALIVFFSDHGEGLMDHGEDQHGILLYRESLQVPLFVKLPGSARAHGTVAEPVSLNEVFGTVLTALGFGHGESSILNRSTPHRSVIYSETLYPRLHLGWSDLRSLIDDQYQYLDSPAPELYDLRSDRDERHDLAASLRRITNQRRQQLQQFAVPQASIRAVDPEEAAKLAALGYIGTPANREGPLPNPREMIASLGAMKAAFALADQGRYDDVIPAFQRLLHDNPRLADVRFRLADVLIATGRASEAVTLLRDSLAHTERPSSDLFLALGFACLENGELQRSLDCAALAQKESPRESQELMARAHARMQQFALAERDAQQAIELSDQQPEAILLLAQIQHDEGKLQTSLETVTRAQRRAGDMEVAHLYGSDFLKGDLLARMDRPDEAIAAYRTEIAHSPRHLQSYANLAIIRLIEGDRIGARRVLDEMVERNPHQGARTLAAKTLAAFETEKGVAR